MANDNPTSPASSPEATQQCARCGQSEVGWKYNRCPNCGEMATQQAAEQASGGQPDHTTQIIRAYAEEVNALIKREAAARAEPDELRSQLANMGALLTENRNLRDDLKTQLAETRGIAGALAAQLADVEMVLSVRNTYSGVGLTEIRSLLARAKAAGISPEEKL